MKLRYIGIDSPDRGYSNLADNKLIDYAFSFNCRFIENYLSLAIRKFKYETRHQYRMICVSIRPEFPKPYYIVNDAIDIALPLSDDEILEYLNMTNLVDRYEFYLSILERGYHKAAEYFDDVPIELLLSLHQQFRDGGYKNEWLFKKKPIREYGIYIYLKCYFTTFEFRLELEVYDLKQTKLITKGVIFRTLPDETFFDYVFKAIKIEKKYLFIIGFLEKLMIKIDLELLAKGTIEVTYLFRDLAEEQQNSIETIKKVRW